MELSFPGTKVLGYESSMNRYHSVVSPSVCRQSHSRILLKLLDRDAKKKKKMSIGRDAGVFLSNIVLEICESEPPVRSDAA